MKLLRTGYVDKTSNTRVNTTRHSSRRRSNQFGGIFLETAVAMPLLAILLFGMIDFGRWLFLHQALSLVAYEGVRIGSKNPDFLEVKDVKLGDEATKDTTAPGHATVCAKVEKLLVNLGFGTMKWNYSSVKTGNIAVRDIPPNSLLVRVSVPFHSLFFHSLGLSVFTGSQEYKEAVTAVAIAPYLYPIPN